MICFFVINTQSDSYSSTIFRNLGWMWINTVLIPKCSCTASRNSLRVLGSCQPLPLLHRVTAVMFGIIFSIVGVRTGLLVLIIIYKRKDSTVLSQSNSQQESKKHWADKEECLHFLVFLSVTSSATQPRLQNEPHWRDSVSLSPHTTFQLRVGQHTPRRTPAGFWCNGCVHAPRLFFASRFLNHVTGTGPAASGDAAQDLPRRHAHPPRGKREDRNQPYPDHAGGRRVRPRGSCGRQTATPPQGRQEAPQHHETQAGSEPSKQRPAKKRRRRRQREPMVIVRDPSTASEDALMPPLVLSKRWARCFFVVVRFLKKKNTQTQDGSGSRIVMATPWSTTILSPWPPGNIKGANRLRQHSCVAERAKAATAIQSPAM